MPAPDLHTIEELCQPTMNGRGGPISPVSIQATDFGLKNHMIQQVQNSCQFHGLPGDDANTHLDKFLIITQSLKQNKEDLRAITTQSGVTLAGPSVPPPTLSSFKEVEQESKTTTDQVLTESTTSVPPLVVQPSLAFTSFELPSAPVSSHRFLSQIRINLQ
nr:reverse transcriptase domain-containing protein [Tanacetum cinerariifolium]